MNKKNLVIGLLVAFAIGSVVGEETRRQAQRPLLRWLGGAARLGLKLMVLGEQPAEEPTYMHMNVPEDRIDHRRSL